MRDTKEGKERKQKAVRKKQVGLDERAKQPEAQPSILLEWIVHLARKRPAKAAMTIAIIAFVLAFGWIWVHPFVAFLMALFLLNIVGEFLFPVRYKVTKEGVEVSSFLHKRKIRWEQIRRLEVFNDSLFLSPYPKPSRLDNLRGLWLRWDGEPEGFQRLIQICQSKIQAETQTG
ncbi:MAG: hypothetical protein NZ805_08415 [Armatimonadetes bacterium]|nr:hypothetical protein [Armatimonadota bacterium]MDW8027964.1 hypothetical protein [Armatimonadota bacterium]